MQASESGGRGGVVCHRQVRALVQLPGLQWPQRPQPEASRVRSTSARSLAWTRAAPGSTQAPWVSSGCRRAPPRLSNLEGGNLEGGRAKEGGGRRGGPLRLSGGQPGSHLLYWFHDSMLECRPHVWVSEIGTRATWKGAAASQPSEHLS